MEDRPVMMSEVNGLFENYSKQVISVLTEEIMKHSQELNMSYTEQMGNLMAEQIRALLRVLVTIHPEYKIKEMFLALLEEEKKNRGV